MNQTCGAGGKGRHFCAPCQTAPSSVGFRVWKNCSWSDEVTASREIQRYLSALPCETSSIFLAFEVWTWPLWAPVKKCWLSWKPEANPRSILKFLNVCTQGQTLGNQVLWKGIASLPKTAGIQTERQHPTRDEPQDALCNITGPTSRAGSQLTNGHQVRHLDPENEQSNYPEAVWPWSQTGLGLNPEPSTCMSSLGSQNGSFLIWKEEAIPPLRVVEEQKITYLIKKSYDYF